MKRFIVIIPAAILANAAITLGFMPPTLFIPIAITLILAAILFP